MENRAGHLVGPSVQFTSTWFVRQPSQGPFLGPPKLMDGGVKFPGGLPRGRTQTVHFLVTPLSVQAGGPSAGLCQGGWQG